MRIRCLSVSVYRDASGADCTNSGISSHFSDLLIYCPDGPRCFWSEQETPLNFCMIRKRALFGEVVADIIPAMVDDLGHVVPRPGWWMHGGNCADSCDSRFREQSGVWYPLHIHDRREW